MYTQETKKKLQLLLAEAKNTDKVDIAVEYINRAIQFCPEFADAYYENKWDYNLFNSDILNEMLDWTDRIPVVFISNRLKKALALAHSMEVDFVSYPINTFIDEYFLPNDDKSYVIFHKDGTYPDIIDKLDITKRPKSLLIWKDWVMTITYHA